MLLVSVAATLLLLTVVAGAPVTVHDELLGVVARFERKECDDLIANGPRNMIRAFRELTNLGKEPFYQVAIKERLVTCDGETEKRRPALDLVVQTLCQPPNSLLVACNRSARILANYTQSDPPLVIPLWSIAMAMTLTPLPPEQRCKC